MLFSCNVNRVGHNHIHIIPLYTEHKVQACAQTVRQYGAMTAIQSIFLLKTVYFRTLLTYFTVQAVQYGMVYGTVPSWHCQCNFGLRKASPPQHFPFPPPAYSSHVLTSHNASLDDPETGFGLYQFRRKAQQWLAWKPNSDALLDYKPHEESRRGNLHCKLPNTVLTSWANFFN